MGLNRALFLDRDGVINEDTGFVHRAEECRFVPGIFELATAFAGRGFLLVIVTNQSGIGRGLFTEAQYRAFMGWVEAEFARHGAPIARSYHCPDHPTAGIGAYRRESSWRKPAPGMLLQAAADLHIDLARSWAVGDRARDSQAARAAGVGTIVEYDPAAPAVARRGDLWIVPRLADMATLLAAEEVKC